MAEPERQDSLSRLSSLLVALPLALAAMKYRKGRPHTPEMLDDLTRDIRGRMNMLLQGKAPAKEPDPSIIRQLTSLGQRTDAALNPVLSPEASEAVMRYRRIVPPPSLPVSRVGSAYRSPDFENLLYEARDRPGPRWENTPIQQEVQQYVAPNLLMKTTADDPSGWLPMLGMKSEWWNPPWWDMSEKDRTKFLYDLMRKGLFP